MIGYSITKGSLRAAILASDANWFADATAKTAALPLVPVSDDFKPHWSKIKQVFVDLQEDKCCFCEKPLEGKIEQDVEHFRPKVEVKAWKVPAELERMGVVVQQKANHSSEPGYKLLAYEPFNYAMACKTCNSTLKKNYFPIEGTPLSGASDPWTMTGEKALLIYPIGGIDDPESMIKFEGLSAKLDCNGEWAVFFRCPYCKKEHTHGWNPGSDPAKPSHRIAHCTKPHSPYRDPGYFIVLDESFRVGAICRCVQQHAIHDGPLGG